MDLFEEPAEHDALEVYLELDSTTLPIVDSDSSYHGNSMSGDLFASHFDFADTMDLAEAPQITDLQDISPDIAGLFDNTEYQQQCLNPFDDILNNWVSPMELTSVAMEDVQTAGYLEAGDLPALQEATTGHEGQASSSISHHVQESSVPPRNRRAPKSATLSTKFWKPHWNRISQLYVTEKKSIEDTCSILNEELHINAKPRQILYQIKLMSNKKHVERDKREAITHILRYRTQELGKKSTKFRVRGHQITQETLKRWEKELAKENVPPHNTLHGYRPLLGRPPSLLSGISVYTKSVDAASERLTSRSFAEREIFRSLLRYTQLQNRSTLSLDESRKFLDNLQRPFNRDYIDETFCQYCYQKLGRGWVEDMMQLRIAMNRIESLSVLEESKDIRQLLPSIHDAGTSSNRVTDQHVFWTWPHGRVQASFWTVPKRLTAQGEDSEQTWKRLVASRAVITPHDTDTFPFHIVFDFAPHHDPMATITYQVIIPETSEIFKIVGYGEVSQLMELLDNGSARLSIRDEQGRSLLGVSSPNSVSGPTDHNQHAMSSRNTDMCKFLIDNKADVNSIELELRTNRTPEILGPVYIHAVGNDVEMEATERERSVQCVQLALEDGADFSLNHTCMGTGPDSNFVYCVYINSCYFLKQVLDLGGIFIDVNAVDNITLHGSSALDDVANSVGYYYGCSIDVVEKAILLLQHGACVNYCDRLGKTILHFVLESPRLHEDTRIPASFLDLNEEWDLSFTAPLDLLVVLITAGANVYAKDYFGRTVSDVAKERGRMYEWVKALEWCGFDAEAVCGFRTSEHQEPQTSKLSFEEYCKIREQRPLQARDFPGYISLDEARECQNVGKYDDSEDSDVETDDDETDEEEDDNETYDNDKSEGKEGEERESSEGETNSTDLKVGPPRRNSNGIQSATAGDASLNDHGMFTEVPNFDDIDVDLDLIAEETSNQLEQGCGWNGSRSSSYPQFSFDDFDGIDFTWPADGM